MKKLLASLMLATVALTGYSECKAKKNVTKISCISKLHDDSKVVLEGYIVKHLYSEYYRFKDETGEITLEIDTDDIKGIKFTPTEKVRLYGEVELEDGKTEVDISHVEKINEKPQTVKQVIQMPDNHKVKLVGKITKHLNGELYSFSDKTGEIVIEVDNDELNGLSIQIGSQYKVLGEIDKEFNSLKIEVDDIQAL
jgi:uncharacterized protein (TIGR00156 family)